MEPGDSKDVKLPSKTMEIANGLGVGKLGTPKAGAALGVNLRMLERPPWLIIVLAQYSKSPAWQNCSFFKIKNRAYWHLRNRVCI